MNAPARQTEKSHPIQVVSRRTGITPDSLRAWEKRYGAVHPERTPTGRRLYSDEDVDRLRLLRQATLGGRSIGQIAGLPTEELRALVAEDEAKAVQPPPRAPKPLQGGAASAPELLEEALDAAERLDPRALEETLSRARLSLSRPALLEEFVVPLVQRVGDCWRDGKLRISHEHLVTAALRSFLARLQEASPPPTGAPVLIASTPTGQVHELGLLAASAVAADHGWDVVYLGPDVPAEEIASAALAREARAVALSLVYPADDRQMGDVLAQLRALLPAGVEIVVGGRSAESYAEGLQRIGAHMVTDLRELRTRLEQLRTAGEG
jgi:DNA-binding transcriptional MerR regulator/methylmalonyl-CoA mutase cobalamin-binding subunit